MTHLAVVEAAEVGTTTEWHTHVAEYTRSEGEAREMHAMQYEFTPARH